MRRFKYRVEAKLRSESWMEIEFLDEGGDTIADEKRRSDKAKQAFIKRWEEGSPALQGHFTRSAKITKTDVRCVSVSDEPQRPVQTPLDIAASLGGAPE